jgi:transcriptional regulator with XRE-family HTH domain
MRQAELARQSGVSLRTLKRIENGGGADSRTLISIRAALERRGVIFIAENGDGLGVRLKKTRR